MSDDKRKNSFIAGLLESFSDLLLCVTIFLPPLYFWIVFRSPSYTTDQRIYRFFLFFIMYGFGYFMSQYFSGE